MAHTEQERWATGPAIKRGSTSISFGRVDVAADSVPIEAVGVPAEDAAAALAAEAERVTTALWNNLAKGAGTIALRVATNDEPLQRALYKWRLCHGRQFSPQFRRLQRLPFKVHVRKVLHEPLTLRLRSGRHPHSRCSGVVFEAQEVFLRL